MGSLNLPRNGLVYVDAPILIYSIERHPTYASLLDPFWQAAQAGQLTPISSELMITEVLVLPLRRADAELQTLYETALFQADLTLFPLNSNVLHDAARLRAMIPGLRTPDALHAATAFRAGCTLFLTNDVGFRRVPELPLVVLDDVLAN